MQTSYTNHIVYSEKMKGHLNCYLRGKQNGQKQDTYTTNEQFLYSSNNNFKILLKGNSSTVAIKALFT